MKNKKSQIFKTESELYKSIEDDLNTEKEVKLFPDTKTEEVITKNFVFQKCPRMYWVPFKSELFCIQYKKIKSPVIFVSNRQNSIIKLYSLFGLDL